MKILLVSPSSEDDLLSSSLRDVAYLQAEAFFAPHAIAAVAALTPEAHEVRLHDEALAGSVIPALARDDFDVVGLTCKATQLDRVLAIARAFRRMGCPGQLVIGGIGVSYMLPSLINLVDTAFLGEAEETWPLYLEELSRGAPRRRYQRASKPDMSRVPAPRWDLIARDIPRYSTASVQTTRGCHFDCSFCDVIYTFGRTPRIKDPDQVIEEVKALKAMGARMIYFADDNFCTDRARTKELLRKLEPINNAYDEPIGFVTQIDITIARDEELLCLLADCNFNELQIGIESSAPESLGDLNKRANTTVNLVDAVRKIQAHGLLVMAHMIIGADSDGPEAFDRTLDFIEEANLITHLCHPLAAPPGTRLWYQLKREGRLLSQTQAEASHEIGTGVDAVTNIVPRRMSRVELLEGLADYWERAHRLEDLQRRVHRFLDGIERVPRVSPIAASVFWQYRKMFFDMVTHHLVGVSGEERRVFFELLGRAGREVPLLVPRVIFAHTNFVMDRRRALDSARRARQQASWERANPEALSMLPRETPLPMEVRKKARRLFEPAYHHVRAKVEERERLYQAVIDAMIDYTDRFGATFVDVDEVEHQHILESCDRVLAALEQPEGAEVVDPLPRGRLPRGFTREILDGLDQALRLRESV